MRFVLLLKLPNFPYRNLLSSKHRAMSGLPRWEGPKSPEPTMSHLFRRSFRHIQMLAKQQSHTLTLGQLMRSRNQGLILMCCLFRVYEYRFLCFFNMCSSLSAMNLHISSSFLKHVSILVIVFYIKMTYQQSTDFDRGKSRLARSTRSDTVSLIRQARICQSKSDSAMKYVKGSQNSEKKKGSTGS